MEPEQELEANEFAMRLLVPTDLLIQDVRKARKRDPGGINIHSLAMKYQVTDRVMEYRLIQCGLISPI